MIRPTKDFCILFFFKPQAEGLAEGTLAVAQFPAVPYVIWCIEVRVVYEGEGKDEEYFMGMDEVLAHFESRPKLELVKLRFALGSMPNQDAIERKINQILSLMRWTRLHCGIEVLFECEAEEKEEDSQGNGGEHFVLVN